MSLGRLTPLQERILGVLADVEPAWVLTGGGALAGFHTKHRATRDLDLVWHGRARLDELVPRVRDRLRAADLEPRTLQEAPSFHRFEVRSGGAVCVVDLVADEGARLGEPETFDVEGNPVHVEGRPVILVNKLCALLGRSELRDLIDVRELVRAGEDLERASDEAPRKDGGYSPLVLSYVLAGANLETMARAAALPDGELRELEAFRKDLIQRLTRLGRPDEQP